MLSKLKEEDFAVLRGPFESGRQGLESLAVALIISVFLQPLMMVVVYLVAADWTYHRSQYPYIEVIFIVHLSMTGILILLSILYAIPSIYLKGQKMQYLLSILVSQNLFGFCPYLMVMFFIGQERIVTESSLLIFTFMTLLVGLIIIIITFKRYYKLLKNGEYRKGRRRDEARSTMEFNIKEYMPLIIVASISLMFIIRYLVTVFGWGDIETVGMMTLFLIIFFAMCYVLVEQLIILYCKFRFESFNFNKKSELKPMGRKEG